METDNHYPIDSSSQGDFDNGTDMGATPGINGEDVNRLEQNGPNKSKPFNVLNQDGSFADYTENHKDNNTIQDGTVGLGT